MAEKNVWNVKALTKFEHLGYRNDSYVLRVNGKVFKFPTYDEAWEYIEEAYKDSGE